MCSTMQLYCQIQLSHSESALIYLDLSWKQQEHVIQCRSVIDGHVFIIFGQLQSSMA